MKNDQKDTTIKDIARITGYSIATVSRVLNKVGQYYNEETAKKILQAAKDLNYSPHAIAKGLKSRRTYNIAFLVQQIDDFSAEMYLGMQDAANEFDYSVVIMSSNYDKNQEIWNINRLRAQRYDGIIIATGLVNEDLVHDLKSKYPIVMVDRITTDTDIPYVSINDEEITYKAASYLLGLGHEKIAYISAPLRMVTLTKRYAGYTRAFQENNIPFNPDLCFFESFLERTDYKRCYEFVKDIVKKCDFSALMVISDLGAIASLLAFHDMGLKIPEDVSIMGFDNIPYSEYCIPPLSTVSQNKYEMGYQGCKMLIDLLEGKQVQSKTIDAELVIRSSTGVPANKIFK